MRKKLKKKSEKSPVSCIVPKYVKGSGPLGVFEHPFFWKIEKTEGVPFGDIKKMRKKVSQSRNNLHKKFLVKGGTRTHVLLLGRPQKIRSKRSYINVAVSGSQLIKLIKSVTSLVLKKESQ